MHYQRQRRGVDMNAPEERRGLCLSERLWQHIDVRDWDECWEWQARRTDFGYGQFKLYPPDVLKTKTVQAHRVAWEMFWGKPLQNFGLHRCNNPPCCNPLHVYDGTSSQNALDAVAAGTSYFLRKDRNKALGERMGLAKLTDDKVREIRTRYAAGGVSQQALALEYGVNQTKISDVVRRRTWKHVE